MLRELRSMGYSVNACEPVDRVALNFYNAKRRRIRPKPRNVHESREFQCPNAYATAYARLKAKLISGGDVTAHISKRLEKIHYNDALLNDWGLHHLHLRESVGGTFAADGAPLLFAYVTQDDVYCINVLPHGSWAEQELLRILHRNWPEAISAHRLKAALGLGESLSNVEIGNLRNVGGQTLVEVKPGVAYAPIGGGYTSAGTSTAARIWSDRQHNMVAAMETRVRENLQMLVAEIEKHGLQAGTPPAFALYVNEEGFFALETHSRVAFPLQRHSP